MARLLITMAAVSGLISVVLGAFMSHSLEETITIELLVVFQTGVTYQMYHSLAALAVGILNLLFPAARLLKFSAYSFLLGIVLFSGSLYLLALTELASIGFITPIGGTFLIFGWIALCIFGAKTNFQSQSNLKQNL